MQHEDATEKPAFYRSLSTGIEDIRSPDWETVEKCLLDPTTWTNDEISLHSGDEESWLIVVHVPQTGFMVLALAFRKETTSRSMTPRWEKR